MDIFKAGLSLNCKVTDLVQNGDWVWPECWAQKFQFLFHLPLPLTFQNRSAKVMWFSNKYKAEQFSVKAVWADLIPYKHVVPWYKIIWFSQNIPGHSFILWLAIQKKLKTQDKMAGWLNVNDLKFSLCNLVQDDHNHLFFSCMFSSKLKQASNDFIINGRVTWIEIKGIPLKMWSENTFNRISSIWGMILHVEDQEDECKVFWVRDKEIPGWVPDFVEDDKEESYIDDATNGEESNEEDDELHKINGEEGYVGKNKVFTPKDTNEVTEERPNTSNESKRVSGEGVYSFQKEDIVSEKHYGQALYIEIDGRYGKGLAQKAKKDWVKELCLKNKVNFLSLQETKMEKIEPFCIKKCWGNFAFDYAYSASVGTWLFNGKKLLVISVYAPQELTEKNMLWDYLSLVLENRNGEEGFDKLVEESWKEAHVADTNAIIKMMKTLKYLKKKIRAWNKMNKEGTSNNMRKLKADLAELDVVIDKGKGDEDVVNKRTNVVRSLQELEKLQSVERSQLAIRSILIDGNRTESPNLVKSEFLSHFKKRFDQPRETRLQFNMNFLNILNSNQQADLECEVTKDEIERAVWDCGIDKSPGPDGFTLSFYRRYSKTSKAMWWMRVVDAGQWNESNINTIVHVLDCSHHASRLHINMSKSKLLEISVNADKVDQATRKIGCVTLQTPFKYLGLKVGGLMSHPRGGVEKAQFDSMLEKVDGTLLADMRDIWTWSLEGSGDFYVASVRKLLDGNMLPEVASKMRWIKAMPIKVNVHAWRVKLDCLPTRINISRRGIEIESIICLMCGEAAESSRHIFFICRISREILRKIS
ncbi:RNA-directed DNA polymerase, eukaryota [Tanacetum coccineum]